MTLGNMRELGVSRRKMAMTLYMAQFAYTSEAWTAFTKHPEDRTPGVEALSPITYIVIEG
jgi:hypothetical protein